ncbi:MAG: hypothetical protein HUU45_07605 [Leptospiraceae bacterium]|nr:hypothetical protein [Leptospiraceae bacterium]
MVDFLNQNKFFPIQNSLDSSKHIPTENMPAKIFNEKLIVELGTVGLGPTMILEFQQILNSKYLIPTIQMGLYDDFDEDFGVEWIFPISKFEKI